MYSYFSGTNKLQTIGEGLTSYGYTYDKNGNMTSDQLNRTCSIKYDHRNLMTEIRVIKTEANPDPFGTPTIDVLYLAQYRYDEAGNRISKFRYKYTGSTPDPIFEGDNIDWTLQSGEYYVRDISGKEIAIYSGSSLTQWNIWGLDNVGKIPACRNGSSGRNADTTRNYYLKDHLGSISVVLNSTNTVISAQDYDACLTYSALAEEVGYQLENRSYNSSAMKYDFTGKEHDDETSYDYFGARYYDSRIGRWGGVEPLLDRYLSFSPFIYALDNPIVLIDDDGKGPGGPDKVYQYGDVGIMPSPNTGGFGGTGVAEGIVGGIIVLGGPTVALGLQAYEIIYPSSQDQVVMDPESIGIEENIVQNEAYESTNDKVVSDPNIYSERGKTNKKQSDYADKNVEDLLKEKQELSGKKKSKEDKAKLRKIDQELKARKMKPSRQTKDIKTEYKWDQNN